jgi:hypothetical protein
MLQSRQSDDLHGVAKQKWMPALPAESADSALNFPLARHKWTAQSRASTEIEHQISVRQPDLSNMKHQPATQIASRFALDPTLVTPSPSDQLTEAFTWEFEISPQRPSFLWQNPPLKFPALYFVGDRYKLSSLNPAIPTALSMEW